jgi:N-acetylmuramoyl-L-alanine amidase
VRHIFFAAVCTLCAITALLSLPPIGEPHALLVAQPAGDRLSVAAPAVEYAASRLLKSPISSPAVDVQVLGVVELPLSESVPEGDVVEVSRSLSVDATDDPAASIDAETSTTVAPSTSSTLTTTTTMTTTSTTTTTEAPVTTEAPIEVVDQDPEGGVIISDRGIVLPVIGPASAGGWRATTPCGNEVTLKSGQRVLSVDFVLDPGHGGEENGASGLNGAIEKKLNLRIAEIVEWYLEEAGYSVLLTRRSDFRLPLRSRAEIANVLSPLALVSIHHNGGATRAQSTPGTELFVDGGNPESKRLGGILFEEITERLSAYDANWVGSWRNGVSARLNSEGADLYGIHRFTPGVVSVITEAGYLSNESEAALFVDNEVQWSHGRAIAEGLMRWDRSADAGSGFLTDFVDDSSSGTGGFDGCIDPSI